MWKKKIRTIMPIAALLIAMGGNYTLAVGRESTGLNFPISKSWNSSKDEKDNNTKSMKKCSDWDAIMAEQNKDKITHDYIFGHLLEFGEGKTSIEELEKSVRERYELALAREKENKDCDGVEGESEKILRIVMAEVWQKYLNIIESDIKRLVPDDNDALETVRNNYEAIAIKWFIEKYGAKGAIDTKEELKNESSIIKSTKE